jgi:hypothetical protein
MSTENEKATFQYFKNAYACFTIPNKPRKFIYGQLLHNISWLAAENYGAFLMEDKTIRTVDIKTVDAAVARTKQLKGPPSEYVQGLQQGKAKISWARADLKKQDAAADAPDPDDEELLLQLMHKSVEDFRKQQSLKKVTPRVAREKPAHPKSIFPVPSKETKPKRKSRRVVDQGQI